MSTPEQSSSASKETVSRRRGWRLEIGFFVRKVVNGRVIRYKQFPHGSSHVESAGDQPRPKAAFHAMSADRSAAGAEGAPPDTPPPPPNPPNPAPNDDGGSATTEETRFEAGFFVQSATPPEYKDPPDG